MEVYIIYGPPAAGKTTYVREHKKEGDLVVDFDLIKQSISMNEKTGNIGKLYDIAEEIREHLLEKIERREVECESAWVIASLPRAGEREELKERLSANTIPVIVSEEECIRRALLDPERRDKELQLKIIRKWFDAYTQGTCWSKERWD